jgi:two-component system phosphate regulon sensor histidine kinase PhoR
MQEEPKTISTNAALEHERLRSLINSMGDGVIATDESCKVLFYNGAALNILDINVPIEGKAIGSVMKIIDKNNQAADIKKLIRDTTTSTATRDYHLEYTDSSKVNLYLSIAPVKLGYGQEGMKGYVVLLRDITREKSLEEERDEFISVVSHELRTPIAIAEGNISNAEFIVSKAGETNAAVSDALKQAHDQIKFLSGMINDLSTLSRAERGKLNVDIEPINVVELVNELAKIYMPQAEAKGLVIHTRLDPKLEILSSCNLYVREVLQNFITNAIKYTEKGDVTLAARPKEGGVEFAVIDTGIGLSKADQEKVYDKFFRSEDFRTRKNNGTGLGLYVTLKLARLIHAELSLQSELNKGSTFTVFFPNLK